MYQATGREQLVPIEPRLPDAGSGAPSPSIAANEHRAAVAYWLAGDARKVGLAVFSGATVYFGPPNDETLEGHPLHRAGLKPYEFAEVIDSPWVAAMERMNRVHPRHNPETYATLRHFVLPFHDSTFECLAREIAGSVAEADDPASALMALGLLGD